MQKEIGLTSLYKIYKSWVGSRYSQNKLNKIVGNEIKKIKNEKKSTTFSTFLKWIDPKAQSV